jgi:hypothetical protein
LTTISVCAIFRDEAPYLLEWLAFHKVVGVEHFVLYDNNSRDGGRARIERSRLADSVTVLNWPDEPGQLSAYHHFSMHYAQHFNWAAFIDIDEFMLPVETDRLQELLRRYAQFSAVLLNWMTFGPSGHNDRPPGLVIENYTRRVPAEAEPNRHVKSLVRTASLLDVGPTPHVFAILGPSCNARGERIEPIAVQPAVCANVLVLNHYFTKSKEDWSFKVRRGRADTARVEDQYLAQQSIMFDSINQIATHLDCRIGRFAARVHALIG